MAREALWLGQIASGLVSLPGGLALGELRGCSEAGKRVARHEGRVSRAFAVPLLNGSLRSRCRNARCRALVAPFSSLLAVASVLPCG